MRKIVLKIDKAIKDRNLTQRDVAEITGLRPSAISRLARAENVDRISLDHLSKIADALEIDELWELLDVEKTEDGHYPKRIADISNVNRLIKRLNQEDAK